MRPAIRCLQASDGDLSGQVGPGDVIVFIDLFFATTSMLYALAAGAGRILLADGQQAFLERLTQEGGAIGATEPHLLEQCRQSGAFGPGVTLVRSGPGTLIRHVRPDEPVILWSSRGTPGLLKLRHCRHVYLAGLANMAALTAHLSRVHAGADIVLVCAGGTQGPAIEDTWCAGKYADMFLSAGSIMSGHRMDPSVHGALNLSRQVDEARLIAVSPVARMAIARGDAGDIRMALSRSTLTTLAALYGTSVRLLP